jgi:hypothetical protein
MCSSRFRVGRPGAFRCAFFVFFMNGSRYRPEKRLATSDCLANEHGAEVEREPEYPVS